MGAKKSRHYVDNEDHSSVHPFDARLKKVVVKCERLERSGVQEFAQGLVWFFTGDTVRIDKWFSHFQLLLSFEDAKNSNKFCVLIERLPEKVKMVDAIESDGQGVVGRVWDGTGPTWENVVNFVKEERTLQYSEMSKNCKHFAYDFFRRVIKEDRQFEDFCGEIEHSL